MGDTRGFTLIELLVVVIIIGVLASIAIPTYFSQREKAQDSAAYSLVRNGFTAIQTAWVDHTDYLLLTAEELTLLEPSIVWVEAGEDLVSVSPPGIDAGDAAEANDNEVAFYAQSATVIDIVTKSGSGNWYGIQVDSVDLAETGYVKVKVVDDDPSLGW